MKSLLDFLYKHKHWLLFFMLEGISFVMLFAFNDFQGSIWISTANGVSGHILEIKQKVVSYFGLREENELLAEQNARLEEQLYAITQGIDSLQLINLKQKILEKQRFEVIPASVIENSINLADNYITINKGLADGVQPNMGVISSSGIVGVTFNCSRHYSLVISVLNSKSNISCKVTTDDSFGILKWTIGDAQKATICDIQRYANLHIGDTVVTSGHSVYFPEGLMVGTINNLKPSVDNLFYNVSIDLSTDFCKLRHVFVIQNSDSTERLGLLETIDN